MNSFRRLWNRSGNNNRHQWKVIFLCVLVATTFWFFNALNKSDYTSTIDLPVEFVYPGKDTLSLISESSKSIRINVTGGGWNLFRQSFGLGTEPLQVSLSNPLETNYILGYRLIPVINEQYSAFLLNSVVTDTLHLRITSVRGDSTSTKGQKIN